MKRKLLIMLVLTLSVLLFTSCDSITDAVDAVTGDNTVTISGNISKSFEAQTVAGTATEDTVAIFAIDMLKDKKELANSLYIFKISDGVPPVGKYNIINLKTIADLKGDVTDFIGSYMASENEIYFFESGTVDITKSSNTIVAGTITGKAILSNDTNKSITIKAKFSTVPINLDR